MRRAPILNAAQLGIEGPMTPDEVNDLIRSLFAIENPPLVGGLDEDDGEIESPEYPPRNRG